MSLNCRCFVIKDETLILNKSVGGRESGEDAHGRVRDHGDVHVVRRRDEDHRRRQLGSISQ